MYGDGTVSDGILTGITYRSRHVAARDITALSVTFFNAIGTNDSGLGPVNFKVGIEYPTPTVTPAFFGGNRTIPVGAGNALTSDSVTVAIPKGGVFYVRTFISVATGDRWVTTAVTDGTNWGEGLSNGIDSVDVGGGMIITGDANYLIAPVAITSEAIDVPGVVIYGDSIAAGSGDGPPFLDRGYYMRALNQGIDGVAIPFANLAVPGESVSAFITTTAGSLRKALPSNVRFRDAVVAYGTNDIGALGRTGAQVIGDLKSLYASLAALGIRVWGVTLLPRTTSTDGWATTTNQTPVAGFGAGSHRDFVNTWLRTLPKPLTGVIEVSDVVESSRNSGLWKVSPILTADGVHPNLAGHLALAAAVPVSALGA